MRKEFSDYLAKIGAPPILVARVDSILDFYSDILHIPVDDIFVSEYIKQDNTREYENFWMFNATSMMEAKQFLVKDDFDLMPFKRRIKYWRVEKSDYDFRTSKDSSRLHLEINIEHLGNGDFKASRENCDYLRDVLVKYLIPNIPDTQ